ncbi:cyclase HisF [Salmonella enterica subsp. enterica]|uniref:Cyclase HisF n=1 Tax=Salmonella enterica I TaxID=59201 RepID=A0A3S4HUY7_SALET|nr:cyclase HisF [Salmonella enterica subsp. enterica]
MLTSIPAMKTVPAVTQWETLGWVQEVQQRGAGEIVLNMMNQDGVRNGYDLTQLKKVRDVCRVPLIASGGAGTMETLS